MNCELTEKLRQKIKSTEIAKAVVAKLNRKRILRKEIHKLSGGIMTIEYLSSPLYQPKVFGNLVGFVMLLMKFRLTLNYSRKLRRMEGII